MELITKAYLKLFSGMLTFFLGEIGVYLYGYIEGIHGIGCLMLPPIGIGSVITLSIGFFLIMGGLFGDNNIFQEYKKRGEV